MNKQKWIGFLWIELGLLLFTNSFDFWLWINLFMGIVLIVYFGVSKLDL